jgi:hypothetical protein
MTRALTLSSLTALALVGCTPSATVRQVRQTSDGGTLLVGGGSGFPAAMRQAIAAIEVQCHGVYEVVELSQVQTGQTTSGGVAAGFGPVAFGTSSTSPVFGTSVTYLCRPPQATALNESVFRTATADIVGRRCAADNDCGPLLCARASPAAATGNCALPSN